MGAPQLSQPATRRLSTRGRAASRQIVQRHPFFDELDASLAGLVPEEDVEFAGEWKRTERRTYETARQEGTGSGPFVDVDDLWWRGTLTCAVPIAGIAFVVTPAELSWARSVSPAASLPVHVGLHAYAQYSREQATFTAGLGSGVVGVPIASGADLAGSCTFAPRSCTTAKVVQLVQADAVAFVVLLIQGRFLKTGRKRLWHLREELTSALPPRVREVLTRGRTGSIRV
jgi:hypothetical protein